MGTNEFYSGAEGLPAAHLSNPTSGSAIRPPLRLEVASCDVGAKGLSRLSLLGLQHTECSLDCEHPGWIDVRRHCPGAADCLSCAAQDPTS